MKQKLIVCAAVLAAAAVPMLSEAKGCLKGAAVGGVGGHFAGHHALLGAAAGCAVGHYMANRPRPDANTTPTSKPTQSVQPQPVPVRR